MAEVEIEETFETSTVRRKTVRHALKIEEVSIWEKILQKIKKKKKEKREKTHILDTKKMTFMCALIMHDLFE